MKVEIKGLQSFSNQKSSKNAKITLKGTRRASVSLALVGAKPESLEHFLSSNTAGSIKPMISPVTNEIAEAKLPITNNVVIAAGAPTTKAPALKTKSKSSAVLINF
mmetsp:Transcript_36177/g.46050  ORF Transcript_36177/g.46050 Transcript_36177/m.46050 type:complete len:106 (-) Transcript_36177:808-1125(-)